MRIPSPNRFTAAAFLLATLGLVASASSSDAADPAPLDEIRQARVGEALQDEYHGKALYSRVLEELGEVRPFANVVHAEERHATLLEGLLESRDLPIPPDRWKDADMPTHSSRRDACAAAVEFEEINVALYDRLLADEGLPEDVRQVFEHNRRASLEHHKPAFERCVSGGEAGAGASGRGSGGAHGRCAKAQQAGGCGGCGGAGCGCGGCAGPGRGKGGRGCGRGREASASAAEESGS